MLAFLKNEFIFNYFESFLEMKLRYGARGLRPRTLCLGRLIVFKWPERSTRKNSLRSYCKFLNERERQLTELFCGFIGFIKFENLQIIIRKNHKFLSNMFNFSNFFLEKIDFWGKKNVDIFENSIYFLMLCIV